MNAAEFDDQFNRLKQHFHAPPESENVSMDWFKAVEHYHVDALDRAVTELVRTSQDRFWPALGKVLGLITARIDRYDRQPGKCATCHASTWVMAQPWKSNAIIYEGFQRCPDCGVPAPRYKVPEGRQMLTATEARAYAAGELKQAYETPVSRTGRASGSHGMTRFQPPALPKAEGAA